MTRFWDQLLDAIEQGVRTVLPPQELEWLVCQGRWWSEFAQAGCPPQQRSFDLFDWAELLRQCHDLKVQVAPQLLPSRRGQPEAMELLVRATCRQLYGERAPTLILTGDGETLTLSAPGAEPVAGPLVAALCHLIRASPSQPGQIFHCVCPVEQNSTLCPVDLEALRLSCMDDPEFECELIETFLAEGRRQLSSLARNYVSQTLHSLKGSAAMVGALRLADLLKEQEHALEKHRLPVLEAEFERVADWLQKRMTLLAPS